MEVTRQLLAREALRQRGALCPQRAARHEQTTHQAHLTSPYRRLRLLHRITGPTTVSVKGTQPPPAIITATSTSITTEVDVPFTISYTTVYLTDSSTYSIAPVVSSSRSTVLIQVPPTAAAANLTASSAANHNTLTGAGGNGMALHKPRHWCRCSAGGHIPSNIDLLPHPTPQTPHLARW
jgi:hypothetical protein